MEPLQTCHEMLAQQTPQSWKEPEKQSAKPGSMAAFNPLLKGEK